MSAEKLTNPHDKFFREAFSHKEMAKEFIKKKYELLENSIPNRVKEVNETRDIDSLLEKCKLKK